MHEVRVLIAPPQTARAVLERIHFAAGVVAPNGWHVIPSSARVLEEIVGRRLLIPDLEDPAAARLFAEFSAIVCSALATLVPAFTGAIAATQYWGGAGIQAAAALSSGTTVFPASVSADAIDLALASLGCPLEPGFDAFDSVGLGRWRTMDAFEPG